MKRNSQHLHPPLCKQPVSPAGSPHRLNKQGVSRHFAPARFVWSVCHFKQSMHNNENTLNKRQRLLLKKGGGGWSYQFVSAQMLNMLYFRHNWILKQAELVKASSPQVAGQNQSCKLRPLQLNNIPLRWGKILNIFLSLFRDSRTGIPPKPGSTCSSQIRNNITLLAFISLNALLYCTISVFIFYLLPFVFSYFANIMSGFRSPALCGCFYSGNTRWKERERHTE